jgi:hypothetical protein
VTHKFDREWFQQPVVSAKKKLVQEVEIKVEQQLQVEEMERDDLRNGLSDWELGLEEEQQNQ